MRAEKWRTSEQQRKISAYVKDTTLPIINLKDIFFTTENFDVVYNSTSMRNLGPT